MFLIYCKKSKSGFFEKLFSMGRTVFIKAEVYQQGDDKVLAGFLLS